jgi:hypothetical protein
MPRAVFWQLLPYQQGQAWRAENLVTPLLVALALPQVSGYIDYAHRLKSDPNMEAHFEGTKRLMPRHTDLSFYNWETHLSTSNPTPNFQVGC